jgi:outer membrane protein TolC
MNASSFYWVLGASASEVIFDAGKHKAANEQAWANYRANVANYRQTVLTAFQQVEDNLAALRILSTETKQQDVAILASQRNFDLAMQRYRLGINSYLNVITAQVSLLNNQQAAVNIHLQQMTSSVQLILALGGGWSAGDLPASNRVLRKAAAH